ncbi:hypothetical protein BJ165DRAFT_1408497 [Panaeolus papilionaceus]|nr:hypothetical protein BJ165DRAFT_1408497 [Panaeolus papilionaceus]
MPSIFSMLNPVDIPPIPSASTPPSSIFTFVDQSIPGSPEYPGSLPDSSASQEQRSHAVESTSQSILTSTQPVSTPPQSPSAANFFTPDDNDPPNSGLDLEDEVDENPLHGARYTLPSASPPPLLSSSPSRPYLPDGFVDSGGSSTHALRNPTKPVIPPRFRPSRSKADAAKGSLKDAKAQRNSKKVAIAEDIKRIQAEHAASIEAVATKHKISKKKVKAQTMFETVFKPSRAPNSFNALVSALGEELNADRGLHEKIPLHELQNMVRDGQRDGTITKEQTKKAVERLREIRALQQRGARSSNTAADADARSSISKISKEVVGVAERSGAIGFALFVKGHIHDDLRPTIIQSLGAGEFLKERYNIDPLDMGVDFEQWSCARKKLGKAVPDGLPAVKAQCTNIILRGLQKITAEKSIRMNYKNYYRAIVLKHHVHLLGWPQNVPFTTPSNITNIDDARTLRDCLNTKICNWQRVTATQLKHYRQKYDLRALEPMN